MGSLEVLERMVEMEIPVPLVPLGPLDLPALREIVERGEILVPRVRLEKLVPRVHPETQAPMGLL